MVVAAIISLQSAAGSHTDDILQWIEVRARPAASWQPPCLTTRSVSSRLQLECQHALEEQSTGAHGHAPAARPACAHGDQ